MTTYPKFNSKKNLTPEEYQWLETHIKPHKALSILKVKNKKFPHLPALDVNQSQLNVLADKIFLHDNAPALEFLIRLGFNDTLHFQNKDLLARLGILKNAKKCLAVLKANDYDFHQIFDNLDLLTYACYIGATEGGLWLLKNTELAQTLPQIGYDTLGQNLIHYAFHSLSPPLVQAVLAHGAPIVYEVKELGTKVNFFDLAIIKGYNGPDSMVAECLKAVLSELTEKNYHPVQHMAQDFMTKNTRRQELVKVIEREWLPKIQVLVEKERFEQQVFANSENKNSSLTGSEGPTLTRPKMKI